MTGDLMCNVVKTMTDIQMELCGQLSWNSTSMVWDQRVSYAGTP